MGLNEAAGYGAVALTAFAIGVIAAEAGLRPEPFLLGLAIVGLGLGASVLFVRETSGHVERGDDEAVRQARGGRDVFITTTLSDRACRRHRRRGS